MLTKSAALENRILDDIRRGVFPENAPVPSRCRLAEKYECSRTTVERAIARLTEAGYLRSRKGSGTYVRSVKPSGTPGIREVTLIAGWNILEDWLYARGMSSGREAFGVAWRRFGYEELPVRFESVAQPGSAAIWVMPSPEQLERMEYLRKKGIPQLLVNRRYRDFDYVTTDAEAGLREGLAWLMIESGRDIALVSGLDCVDTPFSMERQLLFFRICVELGARLHPEFLFTLSGDPLRSIQEFGNVLFRSERRPRGICVLEQTAALPLVVCARNHGLEPGRDFHLLTFDRVPDLARTPGIGRLAQDFQAFNAEIVRWVDFRRNGENSASFRIAVRPEFLAGE